MTVSTLFEAMPLWLAGDTPAADVSVLSICTLSRNMADIPFVNRCSAAECGDVETRVVRTLDGLGMLSSGEYFSLPELSPREVRFLAERKLITRELAARTGPRGVYVAEDQSLSVMVNGADHVTLRAMVSGFQLQEAWARVNLLDDTLSSVLDFAFDAERGFLTADFQGLGTGLRAAALLHLPVRARNPEALGVKLGDRIELHGIRAGGQALFHKSPGEKGSPEKPGPEEEKGPAPGREHIMAPEDAAWLMAEQSHYTDLSGAVAGSRRETLGDLFMVTHQGALGTSEDELLYRVRKAAERLIREEQEDRAAMVRESESYIRDRVGRARALSAGVHLLTYGEALAILSSMRLGVSLNLVPGHGIQEMNEVLLSCQGAHLEMAKGRSFDVFELSRERAELFRSRFS